MGRGVYGTVLAAVCCLAVMFRTRQYRTGAEVLAGLTSGILGLVSVAVSMLLIHDGWRAGAAIGLAGVGAVLLALTLVPASASVRRGRMGDVVETVTLLALLPADGAGGGLRRRAWRADRWPPRRTSSRPTPSAAAGWSPRSSPARPAAARSSRCVRAGC